MDRNLIYFDGICFELVVSSSLRLWRRIFAPRIVIHLGMIRFSKESRTYGRIRSDLISLSVEAAHKGAPAVEFLSQIDTFVCHCRGAVFFPLPKRNFQALSPERVTRIVCGIIKIYSLESLADAPTAAE